MPKAVKRTILALLCVVLAAVLLAGGYVAYVALSYSRIPDHAALDTQNPQAARLQTGAPYTALAYNIGFGAYDPSYTCFMDTGEMRDGTPVQGRYGTAQDKDTMLACLRGVGSVLEQTQPALALLQEIDTRSDRSFRVDQTALARAALPGHSATYAPNFHTAYLAYPLHDWIGRIESGLLTLSAFEVSSSERRSLPVDGRFPTKLFDLDRCFSLHRLPVEPGGELVLVNLHLSAYDEGGIIRAQQLEMLADVLAQERAKGNWVIAGGDFNHALGGTLESFPSGQNPPPWIFAFDDGALPEGFSVVRAGNLDSVATCRSADIPYVDGVNYTTVVDGFIVSDNLTARATNLDTGFRFSDHNPVLLQFTLDAADGAAAP